LGQKAFRGEGNTQAMKIEKVPGNHKEHHVKIYTLSTCVWCKKTKELLKGLDVEYEYVDVDILSGSDLDEATEDVKKYNPYRSFPTIVVDDGKHVILGFNETEIRKTITKK
jgi:glutaredoxin-like protein NrdH